jgi:hypothetical protein
MEMSVFLGSGSFSEGGGAPITHCTGWRVGSETVSEVVSKRLIPTLATSNAGYQFVLLHNDQVLHWRQPLCVLYHLIWHLHEFVFLRKHAEIQATWLF